MENPREGLTLPQGRKAHRGNPRARRLNGRDLGGQIDDVISPSTCGHPVGHPHEVSPEEGHGPRLGRSREGVRPLSRTRRLMNPAPLVIRTRIMVSP
jgi:hypothetical protein